MAHTLYASERQGPLNKKHALPNLVILLNPLHLHTIHNTHVEAPRLDLWRRTVQLRPESANGKHETKPSYASEIGGHF
jgi:hypothetical protein